MSEVECPSCDREFENTAGFNSHWGHMHKGPTPENVDTTRPDLVEQNDGKLTKECGECGELFDTWRGEAKFCSEDCYTESIAENDVQSIECETCENSFETRRLEAKYCSRECYYQAKREKEYDVTLEENTCEECGENFESKPAFERDYCSQECQHKSLEGSFSGDQYQWSPKGRTKVEKTGHKVLSEWEKEIDIFLYKSNFDYQYEEVTFEYNGRRYTPDFVVENEVVIEVKGRIFKDVDRYEEFMEENNEKYIVIGNKDMPSDIHIPWRKRDSLTKTLKEELE